MKAFLYSVVAAVAIAVVAAWVLQDYADDSASRAFSTEGTRIN